MSAECTVSRKPQCKGRLPSAAPVFCVTVALPRGRPLSPAPPPLRETVSALGSGARPSQLLVLTGVRLTGQGTGELVPGTGGRNWTTTLKEPAWEACVLT